MSILKKLTGQTIVYGLGTIVPRVLNYAVLTFFFSRIFDVREFGQVNELYAYIAFLLIILTYGMETGYFRFANTQNDEALVFSSILRSICVTSFIFLLVVIIFRESLAHWMRYEGKSIYIVLLSAIVALDAIMAIPFARIRKEEKPGRFAYLKLANVLINIAFVLLFFIVLPIFVNSFSFFGLFKIQIDIGFVLVANLITNIGVLLLLIPEFKQFKVRLFDRKLYSQILKYSAPLLLAGLAGTVNEVIDRILIKQLIPDLQTAEYMLGIYSANFKIAILLLIFTQMYRYAIEPFFFNYAGEKDSRDYYGKLMRLFLAISLSLGLGIIYFLDFIKFFIDVKFHEGLHIVPIIIVSYILYGVFFNLSVWYKLTNKTMYGAIIILLGSCFTVLINVIYLPKFGYIAAAYAHLITYSIMVLVSYFYGQKYYRIDYKVLRILEYFFICGVLYGLNNYFRINTVGIYLLKLILISLFFSYILFREKVLRFKKLKSIYHGS